MFVATPLVALLLSMTLGWSDKEPPREWIEPATGHRVVRLSNEAGMSSFYFHPNGFTAAGDYLVLARPGGLAVLDWKTRETEWLEMDMEIAGHEFFSPDGKIIWYDLQTPKSKEFWLAGRVLASEETIKYRVEREHWSVHFNVSADGKLFAGDGGGPHSVAAPGNGQWIYLFTPRDGKLQAEKLVDLSRHDYRLEPNVAFTPDGKWIVFRSNMHGATHTYAVEVKKAKVD